VQVEVTKESARLAPCPGAMTAGKYGKRWGKARERYFARTRWRALDRDCDMRADKGCEACCNGCDLTTSCSSPSSFPPLAFLLLHFAAPVSSSIPPSVSTETPAPMSKVDLEHNRLSSEGCGWIKVSSQQPSDLHKVHNICCALALSNASCSFKPIS